MAFTTAQANKLSVLLAALPADMSARRRMFTALTSTGTSLSGPVRAISFPESSFRRRRREQDRLTCTYFTLTRCRAGAPPAMPVFLPAFIEERRQGRRRCSLEGYATGGGRGKECRSEEHTSELQSLTN